MTTSEKNRLIKTNTICWLAAIALPSVLHVAVASTKFLWPIIVPLLLIGPMLASNKLLANVIGETTEDSSRN